LLAADRGRNYDSLGLMVSGVGQFAGAMLLGWSLLSYSKRLVRRDLSQITFLGPARVATGYGIGLTHLLE
jgi:hypothetical protein